MQMVTPTSTTTQSYATMTPISRTALGTYTSARLRLFAQDEESAVADLTAHDI